MREKVVRGVARGERSRSRPPHGLGEEGKQRKQSKKGNEPMRSQRLGWT